MNPSEPGRGGIASLGLASLRSSLARYAPKTSAPGGQAQREPNSQKLSLSLRKNLASPTPLTYKNV